MAENFVQGDRFQITFVKGDTGPLARVNGKVAFPERGGKIPQAGETWEVELAGTNPRGTVHFLRLISRVEAPAEPAVKAGAPTLQMFWRVSSQWPPRLLVDVRTGTSVEVLEYALDQRDEALRAGCPQELVEYALLWEERGQYQNRPHDGSSYPEYPLGSHVNVRALGPGIRGNAFAPLADSFSFGANRSQGSGWLRPGSQYAINTAISRPRVGTDGAGKPVIELPPDWGGVMITGRDLTIEVLSKDDGMVVETAPNAFLLLAPHGKGVSAKFDWFHKNGKWSKSETWTGRLVVQSMRVDFARAQPAPMDMIQL